MAGCAAVGFFPTSIPDDDPGRRGGAPSCSAFLSATPTARPVSFTPSKPACAIPNPVRADRLATALSQPITADCQLVATFDRFLTEVVQPAARQHLGQPVATTYVGPGHQCRRVYQRRTGPMSGHASGRAVDVRGFRLQNGAEVILRRDWNRSDGRGRFMRAVRDGGCRYFDMTLGPEYNAAHKDHFHFEIDAFRICE
ncbi:MAG: extensin family protein [Pseudomonadota bacterium]